MALGENIPAPPNAPLEAETPMVNKAPEGPDDTLGRQVGRIQAGILIATAEANQAHAETQEYLDELISKLLANPLLTTLDTDTITNNIAEAVFWSPNPELGPLNLYLSTNEIPQKLITQALSGLGENTSSSSHNGITNPEERLKEFLQRFARAKSDKQLVQYLSDLQTLSHIEGNIVNWLKENGFYQETINAFTKQFYIRLKANLESKQNRYPNKICNLYIEPLFENKTKVSADELSIALTNIQIAGSGVPPTKMARAIRATLSRFVRPIPTEYEDLISKIFQNKKPSDAFAGLDLFNTLRDSTSPNAEILPYYEKCLDNWKIAEANPELSKKERPRTYEETLRLAFNHHQGSIDELKAELSEYFNSVNDFIANLITAHKLPNQPHISPEGIAQTNDFRKLLEYFCHPEVYQTEYEAKNISRAHIRFAARRKMELVLKLRALTTDTHFVDREANAKAIQQQFWPEYIKNLKPETLRYSVTPENKVVLDNNGQFELPVLAALMEGPTSMSDLDQEFYVYIYNPQINNANLGEDNPVESINTINVKSAHSTLAKAILTKKAFSNVLTDILRCTFIVHPNNFDDFCDFIKTVTTSDGAEDQANRVNTSTLEDFKNEKFRPHITVKRDGKSVAAGGAFEIQIFPVEAALNAITPHNPKAAHVFYEENRGRQLVQILWPPELFGTATTKSNEDQAIIYETGYDADLNPIYVLNPNPTVEPLAA